MENMKKPSRIIIRDYSNYVEGKSSNGGCYIYSTVYKYMPKQNVYEVVHTTSAEFPYCAIYGCFCSATEDNSCCDNAKPAMVTYEMIMSQIKDLKKIYKDNFKEVIKIIVEE